MIKNKQNITNMIRKIVKTIKGGECEDKNRDALRQIEEMNNKIKDIKICELIINY